MISPSQRPLLENTQHSQQTNIHAPGGIRTHDRSRRAAVDLRLRPRGYWDRQTNTSFGSISPLRFYLRLPTPFIFLFSFIFFCFICFLPIAFSYFYSSISAPLISFFSSSFSIFLLFLLHLLRPHISLLYCFLHSPLILNVRCAATTAHCAPFLSLHSSLQAFQT